MPAVEASPRTPRRSSWVDDNVRCAEGAWDEAASFVQILETSGLGHWRHEVATGRFSCSEGFRAMLGLEPEDELMSFEQLEAYLLPEERSLIDEARERAISDTDEFEIEHRLLTREERVRWVMVRGRVARCPDVGVVLAGIAIDITTQKAAESERERRMAELAAERARLHALVAHLPASVLVADASGRVVAAPPAVERTSTSPHPTFPVMSRELFDAWHERHPERRSVEAHESSTVAGAVVIASSVDREKHADEALRSSERRHRQLFDSPVIGIIYSRVDGRIIDANDTFLETFGYTREDLLGGGLSWRALTPPEYRRQDDLGLEELVATGSHHVYEKEYFRKDGTRVPIVLGGTMVEGSATEIATFILDISDRKRVEAERESLLRSLAKSEERYRLAALASDDAIYDWDLESDRVSYQAMYRRVVPANEASWADLIHPEDRETVVTSLHAALEHCSRQWRSEYRFRGAEGEWMVVSDRGYVVCDDTGHPVRLVGAMQDVTARRRQQEFERQLIGIVSHDLRNPLATILLAAEMMVCSTEVDPRTMTNAKRVRSAAERAMRMVGDLLDFTRARLGVGVSIERRPTDLRAVVQTLLDDMRVAHPNRPVVFESSGDCVGSFDADRLIQVVTNLIENALKYSPDGSDVRVTLEGDGDDVLLTVHNGGPAIPAELLPRIFEPLQRGDPTFDPASRSVGLGLYIVKHLVEGHGGRVQVHSSEVGGTTFEVELPRH